MNPAPSYHLILASKSPRRQFLLREMGLEPEIRTKETDETFPSDLRAEEIPLYLCRKKADAFAGELRSSDLLITADTIVWVNDKVLNKPADEKEAFDMLRMLSGHMHEVFTGVCLMTRENVRTFAVRSKVFFKPADEVRILNYIKACQPFDKAGAYGAQECLPEGMKPCSPEEVRFLEAHGRSWLNSRFEERKKKDGDYLELERIEGSYFNVMGLPLVELFRELAEFH